jgi:hypothetical protein
MNLKSPCPRVPLCASIEVAMEWLLSSVGQFVSLKVPFRYELLLALLADKWSFTRVSPHVGF